MAKILAIVIPTFTVILAAFWGHVELRAFQTETNSRLLQIESDLHDFFKDPFLSQGGRSVRG